MTKEQYFAATKTEESRGFQFHRPSRHLSKLYSSYLDNPTSCVPQNGVDSDVEKTESIPYKPFSCQVLRQLRMEPIPTDLLPPSGEQGVGTSTANSSGINKMTASTPEERRPVRILSMPVSPAVGTPVPGGRPNLKSIFELQRVAIKASEILRIRMLKQRHIRGSSQSTSFPIPGLNKPLRTSSGPLKDPTGPNASETKQDVPAALEEVDDYISPRMEDVCWSLDGREIAVDDEKIKRRAEEMEKIRKSRAHCDFFKSMLSAKDDVESWKTMNSNINGLLDVFNPPPLAHEVLASTKPERAKGKREIVRTRLSRPMYIKPSKVKLYNRKIEVNKEAEEYDKEQEN